MMYPKPKVKQLTHLLVPRLPNVTFEEPVVRMVLTTEVVYTAINRSGLFECLGGINGLLPGVYEHHHLMTKPNQLGNFLKGHSIEVST